MIGFIKKLPCSECQKRMHPRRHPEIVPKTIIKKNESGVIISVEKSNINYKP